MKPFVRLRCMDEKFHTNNFRYRGIDGVWAYSTITYLTNNGNDLKDYKFIVMIGIRRDS